MLHWNILTWQVMAVSTPAPGVDLDLAQRGKWEAVAEMVDLDRSWEDILALARDLMRPDASDRDKVHFQALLTETEGTKKKRKQSKGGPSLKQKRSRAMAALHTKMKDGQTFNKVFPTKIVLTILIFRTAIVLTGLL
jgi:hypothetical protein